MSSTSFPITLLMCLIPQRPLLPGRIQRRLINIGYADDGQRPTVINILNMVAQRSQPVCLVAIPLRHIEITSYGH